ncbi:MAG: lysylphosphatidylglycerol synthase transmembrane domain-containing protein [Candidatus Dormiibacterota bacterium]
MDTAARLPQAPRGHSRLSRYRASFVAGHVKDLHRARLLIPPALGVTAIVFLVLAIDPSAFGHAITHFRWALIPAIVAVSLGYYVVQGIRWYFLLVEVGIRLPMRDVVLINLAGQATALLPLGELTRAVLVAQASGADFGAAVAAETVQELIYTLLLILFAVPALVAVPHALGGVVAILIVIAAIFVGMSWCPAYRWLRAAVAHTPLLKRLLHEVDELHNDLVVLVRRPSTFVWSWLSALQAAAMITALWLVTEAVAPGQLSWKSAALVYAVSNVAGLLSLIPGGIGAYEGSVIGLLVGFGLNPGVAAAVAVVQRLASQGLGTLVGFGSYSVAKRRLHLTGIGTIPVRPKPPTTGPVQVPG